MGQQPNMNSGPGKAASRSSAYHHKALAEIRNSLLPFATPSDTGSSVSSVSTASVSSSHSSISNGLSDKDAHIRQHINNMGYTEDLSAVRILKASRVDSSGLSDLRLHDCAVNGYAKLPSQVGGLPVLGPKLIRKPSLEKELTALRGSPQSVPDSGAGSSRSDSPRLAPDLHHAPLARQYSFGEPPPPPLPPPRSSNTPPPPPPPHTYSVQVNQMLKRMSPAAGGPTPGGPSPAGPNTRTSPVARPMVVENNAQVQQQLQQMQALSLGEPPPPYHLVPPPAPPSYNLSMQSRSSPTHQGTSTATASDYSRKSPSSSGVYSAPGSVGSPSPVLTPPHPPPSFRQAKTLPPVIMHSVKSTQVLKPVLQTAIAPTAPPSPPPPPYNASIVSKAAGVSAGVSSGVVGNNTPSVPTTEPPSYASTMQALAAQANAQGVSSRQPDQSALVSTVESSLSKHHHPYHHHHHHHHHAPPPPSLMQHHNATATTAVSHHHHHQPPPPPHHHQQPPPPPPPTSSSSAQPPLPLPPVSSSAVQLHSNVQRKYSPVEVDGGVGVPVNSSGKTNGALGANGGGDVSAPSSGGGSGGKTRGGGKIDHQSPIPERKHVSKEKEDERRDCKVRNYSPQAFKFFMEQHVENVIKSHRQRIFRRMQLENEMSKIGLSEEAQAQMRKMLSQKESNYIRLKRAKMDKSMFVKLQTIGVGAFGEVTLVRKIDTNHLYAMKTLRKADVLKRNQVAHVKAERDILAEADNEWVVKLYYSFQDKDNLYFVMDYIPGGDLMSLLIKLGIFEEPLARFYIAELSCAVESVHRMGFIHRDIKPDNILIDRDGHIKLTDFGLCTGFRWTHNSKYYQHNGDHCREDSMEVSEEWGATGAECQCDGSTPLPASGGSALMKPLERRRRREHQRCLAHSLVGTPNYIAPEVLLRTGYTQLCDWWSVGVILYEMLVGSPPFLAKTPGETQNKVINWEKTLVIPKEANLSPEAIDLILNLCCGAERRLGKNASEVKAHLFFRGIDFDRGVRRLVPPHIPRIKHSTDTSNFDPIDPDKLRNSSSDGNSSSTGDDPPKPPFHGFFEFTFRRFFDDGGATPYHTKISLEDTENQGAVYV